jgi:hypothetical protein
MADAGTTVRVVAIRRGKLRVAEFALRDEETGLSMFVCETEEDVQLAVSAVRAAGKIGHLAAAALTQQDISALGLELIPVPGATPDERVNKLHVEARLSRSAQETARRLGQQPWDFVNQQLAGALHARARLIYEG